MLEWVVIKRWMLNMLFGKKRIYVEEHPLYLEEHTIEGHGHKYTVIRAICYARRDRSSKVTNECVGWRLLKWSHDKPIPVVPWCFSDAKVHFLAAEEFHKLATREDPPYIAFSSEDPVIAAFFPDVE